MKRKSLQEIEDFYIHRGYRGDKLRYILSHDSSYQKFVQERKKKLTKNFRLPKKEARKYVLSTDEDFVILALCKTLEKKKLSKNDRRAVRLLRSQLEHDWRKPLLRFLRGLMKKYAKHSL